MTKNVAIALAAALYAAVVFAGILIIGARRLVLAMHAARETRLVAARDLPANHRLSAGDVKRHGPVKPAVEGRYLPRSLECGGRIRPEELRDAPLLLAVPGTALVPLALTGANAKLVNTGTKLIVDWNAVRYRGPVNAVIVEGGKSTALLRLRDRDLRKEMFRSGAEVFVSGE